jgi:hypothetical protein
MDPAICSSRNVGSGEERHSREEAAAAVTSASLGIGSGGAAEGARQLLLCRRYFVYRYMPRILINY